MVQLTHNEYLDKLAIRGIGVYPLDTYITSMTKILHKCTCGKEYMVVPNKVLAGRLCGSCRVGRRSHISHEEFINKLPEGVQVLEVYKGSKIKHLFKCSCGKEILSIPNLMYKGCHCVDKREVHNLQFYKDKETVLYYVRIEDKYKLGVTLLKGSIEDSVFRRFRRDIIKGVHIDLVSAESFADGAVAYRKEQRMLKLNKDYKYRGIKMINSGNTEIFNEDISKTQISGYPELSQQEINLINDIKKEAEVVRKLVGRVQNIIQDDYELSIKEDSIGEGCGGILESMDWASLAEKDLQVGFMKLVRAVARPTTF